MVDDPARRRLIANRDMLNARLALLEFQAAKAAEGFARNADGLPPSFGRHASNWTGRHERAYQARLADIRGEQRNDRGALAAKIERQNAALRAMIIRDGRNTNNHTPREQPATPLSKSTASDCIESGPSHQ